MKKERISILDSFRALAILTVLLYHFFSRWTYPISHISLYPYNDKYNYFGYGYLGVEFFFIISGFVIFFTLENTSDFTIFWKKRFIRLVPPIIVGATLTYLLVILFDSSNLFLASHKVKNFIPSITFISPQLLNTITGSKDWSYIDGSYWSLWPEVQFYLLSSIIYFFNRENFVKNFMGVSFMLIMFNTGAKFLELKHGFGLLPEGFFLTYEKLVDKGFNLVNYLPFFSLGMSFYILYKNQYRETKNHLYTKLYVLFLLLFILFIHGGLDVSIVVRLIYGIMIALFFLFIYAPQYLKVFDNKLLTQIGESSYFLYLIHQNIGVLIIYYLGSFFLPVGFVLTITITLVMVIVSILYSEKVDRRIGKWLRAKMLN